MQADGKLTEVERPECSVCSLHGCPDRGQELDGPIVGWRFAAASMGLFIVPILLAVAGSLLAGGEHHRQFVGGATGLVLGMGGAVVVGRWMTKDNGEPT